MDQWTEIHLLQCDILKLGLGKVADTLLEDIDKDTVKFVDNYDTTLIEPEVLPARYPNLLVNGSGGITVGMATNIPPHNLGEIVNACILLLEDPKADDEEIRKIILGPDFPTEYNNWWKWYQNSFLTGRGSVIIEVTSIENTSKDRTAIVVKEIPYQVNKSRLVKQIADSVRAKRIEGISDLRDESDKEWCEGVVIELKRDATPEVVFKPTSQVYFPQTSFGANVLALKNGMPTQLEPEKY